VLRTCTHSLSLLLLYVQAQKETVTEGQHLGLFLEGLPYPGTSLSVKFRCDGRTHT
jgi:hypothetical protein